MDVLVILCQQELEDSYIIEQLSKKAEIQITTNFSHAIQIARTQMYRFHIVYTADESFPSSWEVEQFLSQAPTMFLTGGIVSIELLPSIIDTVEFEKNTPSDGRSMFDKSMVYIHANLCDHTLSLEKAASQIFVSRHYYSRMFHKHVGIGFKEYIMRKRIERAQILLKNGHSVTDVCFAIGYNDLTHFAKVFKRLVGVNPSIFRQRWKTNQYLNEWGGVS
jgi:YesN/AraC family two-component response regulator